MECKKLQVSVVKCVQMIWRLLKKLRRQWHPSSVLLLGKSHGWRSLVGCSPWGRQESDMTEWLHFHFLLSCTGEGNGNPFQCSCLENPRDGAACWAAVYGVTQSQTRLRWLSSSSSSKNLKKIRTSCWMVICWGVMMTCNYMVYLEIFKLSKIDH